MVLVNNKTTVVAAMALTEVLEPTQPSSVVLPRLPVHATESPRSAWAPAAAPAPAALTLPPAGKSSSNVTTPMQLSPKSQDLSPRSHDIGTSGSASPRQRSLSPNMSATFSKARKAYGTEAPAAQQRGSRQNLAVRLQPPPRAPSTVELKALAPAAAQPKTASAPASAQPKAAAAPAAAAAPRRASASRPADKPAPEAFPVSDLQKAAQELEAAKRERARKAALAMSERAAAKSAEAARQASVKMAAKVAAKKATTQKLWARCRRASELVQSGDIGNIGGAALLAKLKEVVDAARRHQGE
jgi:hypothetical protein